MALGMVRTYFDFYLNLPEDVHFLVEDGTEQAMVNACTLSGDSIFSFNQDEYNWLINNSDRDIHRVIAVSEKKQIEVPLKYFYNYKDMDMFSGGIVIPRRYSIFNVIFNVPETFATPTDKQLKIYKEKAEKILQKFISIYRWISSDNDIYKPQFDDITIIEYLYSEQENITPGDNYIDFKVVAKGFNWGDASKPPLSKKTMDDSTLELFKNQLKSEKKLGLYQELLLDAKHHGNINNNYEIAILKIVTSIEVFLHQVLIQLAEQNGILELPLSKSKNAERTDYKSAISKGKLSEHLLGIYFKEITGKSIKGSKIYNNWYLHAYTMRNDIVHKGKNNISENEAKNAFESTIALINEILTFIK